jgi:glutamine amidotransferase
MCRHLAYLGPPVSLQTLVLDPPFSLYQQSWAPRRQRHGTVNVDGFGVGWYVGSRAEPVRYRRAQPIWTDASFASLAPTITASCVLAAVRSATPAFGNDESAAAPFTHGRWLFSHNGRVEDWARTRKALWQQAADTPEAQAPVDSALLFGLAVDRWQGGAGLAAGLESVTRDVLATGGGRLTMLATDGRRLVGSVLGEPMYYRSDGRQVLVTSEPDDDEDDWQQLSDGTLLDAVPGRVTTKAMRL